MLSRRITALVSTLCAGAGYYVGCSNSNEKCTIRERNVEHYALSDSEDARSDRRTFPQNGEESVSSQNVPSWYHFLPIPLTVSASSALTSSSLPSPASSVAVTTPTNRAGEIMKFGYPNFDNVRFFEDHVVAYDRRNKTPYWVFEHIKGENCNEVEGIARENCKFEEDESVHPFFRAKNSDYKGSGYDRGHLAAASNHRHSQKAMDQTFILSNIAPQVGVGFNRGSWNQLEKYTRAIARKNRSVYVCTGPLYLPRREADGKVYVKYEVIGSNQVAVPTHFFKVLVIEDLNGQYELKSYVMPNQPLPDSVQLKVYQFPLEAIERAAGFLLFEKIPRKAFKLINGEKPR
ncbi:endonuclease G, mitochondrial-like [Babylonia areolata]|uniref:endonuclease G, mitochondrial-like n=1 Tax=Babylonia areolata TaxID=304850 RepID=UPI003FCF7E23